MLTLIRSMREVTILTWDRANIETRKIPVVKGVLTNDKEVNSHEDLRVLNLHVPNNRTSKYMRSKLELQGEINETTFIFGVLTPLYQKCRKLVRIQQSSRAPLSKWI